MKPLQPARARPAASLLAAALVLASALSCASDRGPGLPQPSPANLAADALALKRAVREAVLPLAAASDEPFASYVERARAVLAAHPDQALRAVAASLPQDARALLEGSSAELGIVLLGTWARAREREARVEALKSLIRHPTVNPPELERAGRTPAFDAFEADLKARAEGLGLRFDHVDHVAYEVSAGEAETAVGVLVHADVVPASEPGWSVDPFAGVVRGDKVLGRGALDDKGPLVAALYAMDALSKSGLALKNRLVLIAGTSEETRWEGIARYQQARALPDALFVADGAFPVGIGEKGVSTVRLTTTLRPAKGDGSERSPKATLVSLHGGEVANQVPAQARATLSPTGQTLEELFAFLSRRAAKRPDLRLAVKRESEHVVVEAAGEAAHGATPAEGHNALAHLIRFLIAEAELADAPCVDLLAVLDERLGTGVSGAGLGLDDAHPRFSPTTVNLGTARTGEDGTCTLALNLRWPPPRSVSEVVASVRGALEEGLRARNPSFEPFTLEHGGLDPFLIVEDGPLVRALVEAYEQVTGEDGAPVTLSGTTYAKAAPGSVTFGPGRPGDGPRIHAADEHITLTELDELTELYAVALARLARSDVVQARAQR